MEIEEIYAHYRELVRRYVPPWGFVLKTDCHNEAVSGFKDLGDVLNAKRTTYVEIDLETIERAKERYPDRHFTHGDIRALDFRDEYFSTVVDLSTIDHIPLEDVPVAISEYHRVLKDGGRLLMVAWCCDERREEPTDWNGPQYFLYEPDLMEALIGFDLIRVEEFHRGGDIYLIEIVGDKCERD